jgi:hypothetical protein
MNETTTERFIRIVMGGAIILLASYFRMPDLLFWALIILGVLLILTGLSGFCPFYYFLKIGTKSKL